jgi:hypothetical protein
MHTACVWSENYRLQSIQLRKSGGLISREAALPGPRYKLSKNRSRIPPHAAEAGGEYRARTGDLLVANQALSQLS